MLTWTKTGRDERGWKADGKGGRRYQIELRNQYILLPTVDGVKLVKCDTLADAQQIAWGYEAAFQQAERLAKAGAR